MGIEPTYPAWKAGVLPLNYTRILLIQLRLNAQSRNRTSDTGIFSPLLYQLSYLGLLSFCCCFSARILYYHAYSEMSTTFLFLFIFLFNTPREICGYKEIDCTFSYPLRLGATAPFAPLSLYQLLNQLFHHFQSLFFHR